MSEKWDVAKASKYLGISEATVRRRLAELGIKPIDYNPMLKRPKKSQYRKEDIDKIKERFFRAA